MVVDRWRCLERAAATTQVQEQLRALDPDLPIFDARTVDDFIAYLRWAQHVFGSLRVS
jgi:hypothetical protein